MPSQRKGTRCLHPRRLAPLLVALLLCGCTAQMAYREGRTLVDQDQIEAGLAKYQQAINADPGNPLYRAEFLRARDRNASRLLERADRSLAAGDAGAARQDYQRVLSIDPGNERARVGMLALEADVRHARALTQAQEALDKGEFELARTRLASILTERPSHEAARRMMVQVSEKQVAPAAETALAAAFRQPISIEFRDAPLKQVLEVISRRSGLNFVFDKDVKADQRTTIFLKNSTVEAALHFLMVTNQLEQQIMDSNTILIYPNLTVKVREYQEMTIKTFFLANADAKVVANTIRTILKTRDVVVDEKLNLIIVRDNPEAVKLATKLVALQDIAEPEVMLDVEILEIKRSRLMELGIAWPASVQLAPLETLAGGPLTLDTLRSLRSGDVGVTGIAATINANRKDGDSNTLANPRIRVRNREKAKVVIGDKVPNITTTISPGASGFASESVNYIDVGLQLNVEPTIYLNNEIAIRISLQVSNLVSSMTTASGTTAYQIGTREASTMLQLKDGENQVLAGLINNEDRSSGSKLPGIGSLPIVGRLFGSARDSNDKTEIVLSITPRLIRNIQRPAASAAEFSAGTETNFRRRPEPGDRVLLPVAPGARPVPAPLPVVPEAPPVQPPQALPPPPVSGPGITVTPLATPETAPVKRP